MGRLEIAKELLNNTKNVNLKFFIEKYINIYDEICNIDTSDKVALRKMKILEVVRFHNCISYIEETKFDIDGWELWEIPIFYSHCFHNRKEKKWFDLVVWEVGNVIPRFLDNKCNEVDAISIEEAIEKYQVWEDN